ncbi:MAG TPA: hypothetical protein VE961_01980 [Pyrinomonadaceae bacterium]|nr:hypothetical protein [Pyrinomonadaceae bacterium]
MKIILWGTTALLALIPLIMYVVYSLRRLNSRRQLLLQTLLTLRLDDAYMQIRHGENYPAWCKLDADHRVKELEKKYFNLDFKAEASHADYFWPVLLMTILSSLGWYFALVSLYPEAGNADFKTLLRTNFVWGFVGAYLASLLSIIDDFRKYSLTPSSYYSLAFRLLFSSTAAYLVGGLLKDAVLPVAAFGVGLFPIEKTWTFITEKTSQLLGLTQAEGELGADLAAVQGLEDSRNRRKLVDIGITSVQALATADPLYVFFQTTLPIRTVVDMIDKAILYLYLGDKVKQLRTLGVNGVIELVALAKLIEKTPAYAGGRAPGAEVGFSNFFAAVNATQLIADIATALGQSPDELKAFIFNMYYDPVVLFIYDVWGRCLDVKSLEASDSPEPPVAKEQQPVLEEQPVVGT